MFCPRSGHDLRLCVLIYKFDRCGLRRLYLVWWMRWGLIDLPLRGDGRCSAGLFGGWRAGFRGRRKNSGIVLHRLLFFQELLGVIPPETLGRVRVVGVKITLKDFFDILQVFTF